MTGHGDVSDAMEKILKEVGKDGVTDDRSVRIEIRNPSVPCLDLVDMPGLVASGNKAKRTEDIIHRFIKVRILALSACRSMQNRIP